TLSGTRRRPSLGRRAVEARRRHASSPARRRQYVRNVRSRRLRYDPELDEVAEHVEVPPAFDDLPVDDPEDVDTRELHSAASGGNTHDLAAMRARGGEVLSHVVAFGDQEVQVTPPIGE